jgi:hypothetical protein
MNTVKKVPVFWAILSLLALFIGAFGQATVHVAQQYEDTVRVAVLWNDPYGSCNDATAPVGQRTRDTVLASIARDPVTNKGIANIKIARTDTMTWAKVVAMFSTPTTTRLPHTIVHVNAGWVTYDVTNGNVGLPPNALYNTFEALLDSATNNKIGLVEVGDDAAWLSTRTFGFIGVQNSAAPMNDATSASCCQDSLWIGLWRLNDNLLKTYDPLVPGKLKYPGVNGIISNTVDSILKVAPTPDVQLEMKKYGAGRCQADADKYSVQYPSKITFLGYQEGLVAGVTVPPDGNGSSHSDFKTIAAIQDTTFLNNNPQFPIVRRAVSLSFQPQWLQNRKAEQQIVYDAVMYTSLTNMIQIATTFQIKAKNDTIVAGTFDTLKALVIDQYGVRILDTATINRITWTFDPAYPSDPTDKIISVTRDSILFTGTKAPHQAHILITLNNTNPLVDTSITIWIIPAAPSHLVIEPAGSQAAYPNNDDPIGTTTIGPAQTTATGYAVLRDQYQNFVRYSQATTWGSNQTAIITVPSNGGGNTTLGQGVMTKVGPMGTARVGAMDNGLGYKDSVTVIVSQTQYDSLAIYRVAGGVYTRIYRADTLKLALLDSAVLVVEGHRSDLNTWELITGNWNITSVLTSKVSRPPPQTSTTWNFYPTDTGRGYISISYQNSASSTISDSIHVLFKPGPANAIEIYSKLGAPGALNKAWPADPVPADTMSADSIFTLLYAKVFNYSAADKIWLSSYESVYDSAQKITWSVSPVDNEDSLLNITGNSTKLKSTQAYRLVRVTASLGTAAHYSILIYVKPGLPNHLVIEGSATISGQALINDQPLASLVIGSNQVVASVYAIIRDIYGNYIGYSNPTQWMSTDTTRFTADTGVQSIGEGIVFRKSDSGTAIMIASNSTVKSGVTLKDSVPVVLQNITYKKIRIYVMNGINKVYPDTIRIATDGSLTVYAEGQRSDDTTRWDAVPVQWAKTDGLQTVNNPSTSFTQSWNVIPNAIGAGLISATRPDAGTASVPAQFTEGPADQIVIYRKLGDPTPYFPFPAIDTIMAGSTDTLVGKIFDRNGKWLSRFENIAVSKNLISWTIQRISGPALSPSDTVDDLSTKTGHITTFTPKIAYSTYHIVVQYKDSIKTRIDSANIYVLPGPADHLVIEPSATITGNSLINDNPFVPDTIHFGSNDNQMHAFAIIRDRYGNFVRYSTNTLWTSLNSQLVTTAVGVATYGEGIVNRSPSATIGTTGVTAVDRQTPSLFDSVGIRLDNVNIIALRIVVRDTVPIQGLQMRSDMDTLLQVQGRRSTDSLWVPVSANWVYTGSNANCGASVSGQASWQFPGCDTSHGTIVVSMGNSLPAMITVTINPGLPRSIVLYNSLLPPGLGVAKLPDPSQFISIAAGTNYQLVTNVFDWKGVWLSQYLTSYQNFFTWGAVDPAGSLNATLDSLTGAIRYFTPTKAYDTVTIVDTLRVNAYSMFMDTVRFVVGPGTPATLVIEPKGNISLNRPNPVDTLQILDNENSNSVYSTIRDKFGNFIRYANVSVWGSLDTSVVSVQGGNASFGEGVVSRNPTASVSLTRIYAVDAAGGALKDSCFVNLAHYHIIALRIVIGNNTNPDSLSISTDQDTTVKVQGLRSDDSAWVDVSATWQTSGNLTTNPLAPVGTSWVVHPTDTGTGWIRVTLNNDGVTKPDTLPVHFTPGAPVRASIQIITPPDSLIAGKPIKAVVTIYDLNGNLYSYTFDTTANNRAAYHDTLGSGGAKILKEPFIIVDGKTILLDSSPWGNGDETFVNGQDTVTFTLYYAPIDSPHQIYANLIRMGGADTIRASSVPFVLLPDTAKEIEFVYPDGSPVPDSLHLTGLVNIIAIGIDEYGNIIGPVSGNWSVNRTLHQISGPTTGSRISYDSRSVTTDENGYLFVNHNGIIDSIYISESGPLIKLISATTRDSSGNGILDHLELDFNRSFTLPANASFAGLTITYFDNQSHNDTLVVKRILYTGTGVANSSWVVELADTMNKDSLPETDWTPTVHLPLQPSYELADTTITAIDGAGPVVWKVKTFPVVAGDHSKDTVVVTFSEAVQKWNAGMLSVSDKPGDIFYVWKKDSTKFVLQPAFLAGTTMKRNPGISNSLTFTMSNGQDLNHNYWVSIADTAQEYLEDALKTGANLANVNNNPKQVDVGAIPPVIKIPFNPVGPTYDHEGPGVFNVINNPAAPDWVKADNGKGAVIEFNFQAPPIGEKGPDGKPATVKTIIRIYDVIGNIVQSAENSDFMATNYQASDKTGQSSLVAQIYWNGSNAEKMSVAAGTYRVVVYLQYNNMSNANKSKYPDQRMIAKLGIQR